MVDPNELLENARLIYEFIEGNPGMHLREISRELNIHSSTLRYHLGYLEKKGLIISKKEENVRIFFIADKLSSEDKNITPLLQQKRFRDIILFIIISDETTHSEIYKKLSMKPSTLSKYIGILESRRIVKHTKSGREKHYYIEDEQRVMELLLTYKKSFWDPFVENVLEIYLER
ncbi:MAG: winged helix-turn-helix transcriptional regulator [Thermoplasmata archaeon]|nr:MAG: winged helix-turn-helix transcriptional regulator [Thermoplasmata archaeon]